MPVGRSVCRQAWPPPLHLIAARNMVFLIWIVIFRAACSWIWCSPGATNHGATMTQSCTLHVTKMSWKLLFMIWFHFQLVQEACSECTWAWEVWLEAAFLEPCWGRSTHIYVHAHIPASISTLYDKFQILSQVNLWIFAESYRKYNSSLVLDLFLLIFWRW